MQSTPVPRTKLIMPEMPEFGLTEAKERLADLKLRVKGTDGTIDSLRANLDRHRRLRWHFCAAMGDVLLRAKEFCPNKKWSRWVRDEAGLDRTYAFRLIT